MISPEIKDRLAKIYELVKRGDTLGEKAAAKAAMDKMIAKYNLEDFDFSTINKKRYPFKYATKLDMQLLVRIIRILTEDERAYDSLYRSTRNGKEVFAELNYLDYVTVSCAYDYFKKHMNVQWKKHCLAQIKKKRKAKTKNKRRQELQDKFFSQYIIASNLYAPEEISPIDFEKLSPQERQDFKLISQVEGGKYNKQMTKGYYLQE